MLDLAMIKGPPTPIDRPDRRIDCEMATEREFHALAIASRRPAGRDGRQRPCCHWLRTISNTARRRRAMRSEFRAHARS